MKKLLSKFLTTNMVMLLIVSFLLPQNVKAAEVGNDPFTTWKWGVIFEFEGSDDPYDPEKAVAIGTCADNPYTWEVPATIMQFSDTLIDGQYDCSIHIKYTDDDGKVFKSGQSDVVSKTVGEGGGGPVDPPVEDKKLKTADWIKVR